MNHRALVMAVALLASCRGRAPAGTAPVTLDVAATVHQLDAQCRRGDAASCAAVSGFERAALFRRSTGLAWWYARRGCSLGDLGACMDVAIDRDASHARPGPSVECADDGTCWFYLRGAWPVGFSTVLTPPSPPDAPP